MNRSSESQTMIFSPCRPASYKVGPILTSIEVVQWKGNLNEEKYLTYFVTVVQTLFIGETLTNTLARECFITHSKHSCVAISCPLLLQSLHSLRSMPCSSFVLWTCKGRRCSRLPAKPKTYDKKNSLACAR